MARNVKIIVKRGAQIIEVTNGRGIPQMRIVAVEIPAMAELLTDPVTGDSCYEFKFGHSYWTVDVDKVEVVTQ